MTITIAIVQARMTSSRLPGKVLLSLAGCKLIDCVINRLRLTKQLDGICVAVPNGVEQDPLVEHLQAVPDISISRGSEQDVLTRTLGAAEQCNADVVARITSDCPFIDPNIVDAVIACRAAGKFDYARTAMERGFPLGFDCEAFTIDSLRKADKAAKDLYEREHVTPYIWRRPEMFSTVILDHMPDRRKWRLVVDTENDFRMASVVYEELSTLKRDFKYEDLVSFFEKRPEVLLMNNNEKQTPYSYLT